MMFSISYFITQISPIILEKDRRKPFNIVFQIT